jgi:hypothetical protein
MKLRILIPLLFAALTAGAAGTVQADDRVRLLGTTRLSHQESDRDMIDVNCRPRVGAIKLRAAKGSAEIEHIWVRYGNGQRDTLRVRDYLRKGSETRWIDLQGGRRCVVAVGVIGDTENSRRQARIEVYGRFGR